MIGIDTEGVGVEGGGGGRTLDTGFCHRMRHSVMIFFKGQVKSPIQGMGQNSMFLTFRTICNFRAALGRVGGEKGGNPGRLHTCLLRSLLKNSTCS